MATNENLASWDGLGYGFAADTEAFVQADQCLLMAVNPLVKIGQLEHCLNAYRQQGGDFVTKQADPRAWVLIDARRQSLILASDPIGLSNIYYAQTHDGIVFGSSADFVIRHPDVGTEISVQSIYDYVYFHHCPSPNTIYRQVKKLEGGQYLIYQDGEISLKRYWQPVFQERMSGNLHQAGQELRQLLVDTVGSMAETEKNTGAFLSGGLDSSSVAGALAQVFPGQAKTFSMGFPVEGYNEIEYANIAVKHFNTRQHEYYVTPEDTVAAVPLIASYYDEPFGNSSALAAYYCAKLAKDNGVTRLLAGDGGDEIFAGNERYAKQMLFDHYHRLPGFAKLALEAGLYRLPQALAESKIPFKAKRYIEQAKTPMPDRLQDYNYLHRHDINDIFQAGFLAQIDVAEPLQLLRDCYRRPENASTLNRMLYLDWKTTLHDNDLVKVNRMCEMAGVEVYYPLLDQRIVDLSCRIPSMDKLKGQKLRWFYKQAMADFLPDRIINKPKHGFGLPFGIWLKDHQPLKELAYDAIQALKKRDYFQPRFLDHAMEMHQSIHAAYYGELIWILMMLELWFQGKRL
ncbi:asparagine synthetase B family protein [Methylomonas rivi]|uniref:asparagine synthase (glutamine-hydrolyzing) n=1 Tax=Methylomonas rivi TaxID=2952226 RepID=A0ABT1U054_9GAMM|nr:asparagine synthase C-terminal domain-containing protein [Methylomonas sp. WSC-6]MCQ8127192.1 asparagine synthase C-terminal domain-containing protein [Methylomonas sp. WSC-6]